MNMTSIRRTKFRYSLLEKAWEKQMEKQADALKSLNFSYKKDESRKKIEGIFPKNILDVLQGSINTDQLYYKSKQKNYSFTVYFLAIIFSKDIHEGYLSLKNADDEQSKFANK